MLQIIVSLLMLHSVPGAVPAKELGPAIIYAAKRHHVDPVLLTQIVLVESGGRAAAYNAKSQDHGLVQINENTRIAYNISLWCTSQWQCNLDSAARILADMWRIKGARPCIYNGGPKFRLPRYETACLTYEARLAKMVADN